MNCAWMLLLGQALLVRKENTADCAALAQTAEYNEECFSADNDYRQNYCACKTDDGPITSCPVNYAIGEKGTLCPPGTEIAGDGAEECKAAGAKLLGVDMVQRGTSSSSPRGCYKTWTSTWLQFNWAARGSASSRASPVCRSGPVLTFDEHCFLGEATYAEKWSDHCAKQGRDGKLTDNCDAVPEYAEQRCTILAELPVLTFDEHCFLAGGKNTSRSRGAWSSYFFPRATYAEKWSDHCAKQGRDGKLTDNCDAVPEYAESMRPILEKQRKKASEPCAVPGSDFTGSSFAEFRYKSTYCEGEEDPVLKDAIPVGHGVCAEGHCFDIDSLKSWLAIKEEHPMTKRTFTEDELENLH